MTTKHTSKKKTTTNRVFVVEQRQGKDVYSTVAYIATSKQRAQAFCRMNKDFDSGNDWWWAIYSVAVNDETVAGSCQDLHFMLPNGTVTDGTQPIPQ